MPTDQQSWYSPLDADLEEVEPESFECDNCGLDFESEEGAAECCPSHECDYCGAEFRGSEAEDEAYSCCRHECQDCGSTYRYEDEAYQCCRYSCPDCGTSYEYEDDAQSCCRSSRVFNGSMPYLPDIDPYRVAVPAIAGRPARLCSVEQELTDGGAMVAALLNNVGASSYDEVLPYHGGHARRGEAHVEEDGSLPEGGGEVVYDRFNLSLPSDSERMSLCLTKIRQLRDLPDRPVRTGFSAGIHIHVSARAETGEMMTPRDVSALYELWLYAEDMLYSFSAAGWNRHRQPNDNYGGYCKPVPKASNGDKSPKTVWNLMNRDRYFGLNFQPLFSAVSNCSCGAARMGDWPSCDCGAMDRATVEWRVFNSSTLPRTIHAWIVFAQAMTAYASRHELNTLPTNEYGSTSPEEKWTALQHLLSVLPLTDGEKELILEVAHRSPELHR